MVGFVTNPTTSLGSAGTMLGRMVPYTDDAAIAVMQAQRHKGHSGQHHKHKPHAPDLSPAVSPIDTALGVGERVTSLLGFAPFLAMPATMVGNGVSWVGKKSGFRPISAVGSALGAPGRYMDRPVEETVFATPINAISQGAAKASAGVVGGISSVTGLDKRLSAGYARKSVAKLGKAKELMSAVPISQAPAAIQSHVRELHSLAHNTSLTTAQAERVGTLLQRVEHDLQGAGAAKAFTKPFAKATKALDAAANHHIRSVHWANPKEGMLAAPARLQKMDLGHTLMQGAWAAGSTISMATDARSLSKNLAGLKQMYRDMTGKNISTTGLLFGKVPPIIAAARSHLIKNTAIKEGTDAIGLLVNLRGLFDRRFNSSMKGMMAYMLPQFAAQGADMIMGESVVPAYQAMKANFDRTQPMPAEYYATYIGELSADLKKRGGANSKFTKVIAEQYAAEHATPEQILREVDNGKLLQRVKAVIAQQAQHPAADKQPRQVMGKHTQQVMQRDTVAQQSHPSGPAVT